MRNPNPSVAVAGSSGFLGRAIVKALVQRGCRVKRLIRTQPHQDTSREVYWNPASGHIERVGLEGVDVVINLVGSNLADRRWTPNQKELLLQSRVQSTQLLSKTLAKLKNPPELFLSASAIGVYNEGFLGELCKEWEAATSEAEKRGIRTIHMRSGVVLDPKGGLLKALLPMFKLGFGATMGSGNQVISWIALADWIAACEFLIFQSDWGGNVDLTAPNPVTNREFGETLASVLHRPFRLRIPESLIEWRYGEMGKALILSGEKVLPKRLLGAGFEFEYPTLRQALETSLR